MSFHGLHRNAKFWPRPTEFDPSRFDTTDNGEIELDEKVELDTRSARKQHPFQYLPFSAGPHNCIGQKFAFREATVTLVHILRTFSIVSHEDPQKPVKTISHGLLFASNMRIAFVPRS
jgi:cytochrome P450